MSWGKLDSLMVYLRSLVEGECNDLERVGYLRDMQCFSYYFVSSMMGQEAGSIWVGDLFNFCGEQLNLPLLRHVGEGVVLMMTTQGQKGCPERHGVPMSQVERGRAVTPHVIHGP